MSDDTKKHIKILLADDHVVVRAGLRALLEERAANEKEEEDLEVMIAEASDGLEAIDLAVKLSPDVVLMDIQMPRADGIAATRKIKLANPNIQIVMLTTFETEVDVTRAINAGAIGYLMKDAPRTAIVAAVRAAARGESTFSPKAATHLMSRARGDGAPSLSRREVDVLERVAKGATNREVAEALRVSEATVKTHLLHAFEKLGVSDRTAAVTVALERKLIRLA
jgi:DNA-binding NarL/FixJ family response regulator